MSVNRYARKPQGGQDKPASLQDQHDAQNAELAAKAKAQPRQPAHVQNAGFTADEVMITLPNNLVVTLATPPGSYHFRLSKFVREGISEYELGLIKALMHVKAIDGEPVMLPTNQIELDAFADRVGAVGVDQIFAKVVEHFYNVDLSAVKKNL